MFQEQKTQIPATLEGMCDYLRSCPSLSLATALQEEIQGLEKATRISSTANLTSDVLMQLRRRLYDRGSDRGAVQDDVLAMLAEKGGSGNRSADTTESRLLFVENLMAQLAAGQKPDFQKAFETATRRS